MSLGGLGLGLGLRFNLRRALAWGPSRLVILARTRDPSRHFGPAERIESLTCHVCPGQILILLQENIEEPLQREAEPLAISQRARYKITSTLLDILLLVDSLLLPRGGEKINTT